MVIMNELTTDVLSDDIYAYALSKTLTKVSSPATVGLYSSCVDRLNIILKKMEESMDHEEKYGRKKPQSNSSCTGIFGLIFRMLFFTPVWTKEIQDQYDIRFIHVNFSAWHFAGSDLLWAGIAIRLFYTMEMSFGKLKMALYRVFQYDEEDEFKKKVVADASSTDWISKKICCCPLWCFILFILLIPVTLVVLLFIEGPNRFKDILDVIQGLLIAMCGLPAMKALQFIYQMGKNLIFNQDMNIKTQLNSEQISSQLGFMNEVRKEMLFLSGFIRFMEVFERRRIRVVLKITNLDRCSPKKIVAVLEAMNILLSDEESPFISILAVNSYVLLEKVKFADGCFCKEDRAHMLLNRIVTLPFTIPPLDKDIKLNLFKRIFSNMELSSDVPSVGIESGYELQRLLKTNTGISAMNVEGDDLESFVKSTLKRTGWKLTEYMLEDGISMRRVINSVWVSAFIIKTIKTDLPDPENVAAWVVLANQWPCRLSWIIQCVEDASQRAAIDGRNVHADCSKSLWDVFNESREELYVMSTQIVDLLEQDGDPEMFEKLLKDDYFKFTIKNLETFQDVIVNLDPSIKKELALIRGTSRLKDSGWLRKLAPLPIAAVINMTTDDLCQEMKRTGFEKYIKIVEDNNINGSSLIFGDIEDLKALLSMTFGEWATFRLHFLNFPSHIQPQLKNKLPPSTHSKTDLSKPCYHSATPSMTTHSCI